MQNRRRAGRRFPYREGGRLQGIVLAPRTEREKAHDLQKLAKSKLNDLELVLVELVRTHEERGRISIATKRFGWDIGASPSC